MAIPGSVVAAGKLITPGGAQGPLGGQGPAGPTVVSTDAGNQAVLGSDSKIFVPDPTPVITSVRLRSFNAIGNPNFEVDQRLAGTGIVNPAVGAFLLDRWSYSKAGVTLTINGSQTSGTVINVPGSSFGITSKGFYVVNTNQQSVLAAGDLAMVLQQVEGPLFRELINDVHSISILAQTNVTGGLKFALSLRDSSNTHSLVKLCTIPTANTPTLIQLPNLPVFPSGSFTTDPGSVGYILGICFACGTTFTAPAAGTWQNGNFVGASGMDNLGSKPINSVLILYAIQHEPGPLCTTFQDKSFDQNLDESLRYYCKSYNYTVISGTVSDAGSVFIPAFPSTLPLGHVPFKRRMAKGPVVTGYSPLTGAVNTVRDVFQSVDKSITGVQSLGESGFGGFGITGPTASNWVAQFHYTADTGW